MSKEDLNKVEQLNSYIQGFNVNVSFFKWVSGIMITIMLAMLGAVVTFISVNNLQHNEIKEEITTMRSGISNFYDYEYVLTDSLSKVNSRRLDIQSDWGYAQADRLDSVDNNHEKRIVKLERKVFK